MPVAILLVEGELDEQILFSLLQEALRGTAPLIERAGSKGSIAPRCRDRRTTTPATYYLRDRDFDFDPVATAAPIPMPGTPLLGWRWSRHELESYLLDPAVLSAALQVPAADADRAITQAAASIRDYQAARWVLGRIRRELPPVQALRSRPEELGGELQLPPDLAPAAVDRWLADVVASFKARVDPVIDAAAVMNALQQLRSVMPSAMSASEALIWCSGKDLLAATAPRLGFSEPGQLRARVRDWVRANPGTALRLIPEWSALPALLTAAG